MNTSFKDRTDFEPISEWFRRHNYPHCKSVNSLASLRSGVAIAEILTEKLPKVYHSLFLPNIEIYNLNPQRAMLNLKIMLNTLKTFFNDDSQNDINIDDFTAEGLYFDHNMMETFILTVLVPLKVVTSSENFNQQQIKENYHKIQDISDIANLSSIIAHHEPKSHSIEKPYFKPEVKQIERRDEEVDQDQIRIQKLCDWLEDHHRIFVEESTPEQIMGELVNSTFTGSRLDKEKVIKQSHYDLGSATVFKKIGDYLLTCERMPKHNVLAMLQEVEFGCMRQELFWCIIEDIMNIKLSHVKKVRKRSTKKRIERVSTKRTLSPSNKQNICIEDNQKDKNELIKKPALEIYECSSQILRNAEFWIGNELGYEHSLKKSKNIVKRQENPLLNGVLLGSIVMRMQLGKVSINKQPKNKKQIDKNMNQVKSCIIRRGIEAGRKFASVKPSYESFLGIIWQVKSEYQRKSSQQKVKRAEIDRQRLTLQKNITAEQKQKIKTWLKSRGIDLNFSSQIPVSIVSQICGDILQLRLFRETTKRIRQTNIQKIINQLRRLGWEGEGDYCQVLKEQSIDLRWSMLKFAHEMFNHKVYFYR